MTSTEAREQILDSLILEFLRNLAEIDTHFLQTLQNLSRFIHTFFQAWSRIAVVSIRIEGFQWDGIHCIRSYESIHVFYITVRRIFRTRTGPEHTLG